MPLAKPHEQDTECIDDAHCCKRSRSRQKFTTFKWRRQLELSRLYTHGPAKRIVDNYWSHVVFAHSLLSLQ
eukprot:1825975-Amphidinium_carterae.1